MITLDRLPKWLFCIPLVIQWMWLAILYRSLTLPSVINPRIENGGLAGESKIVYLNQVDQKFRKWVVQTVPVTSFDSVEQVRIDHGLTFPLVAKPDIGWCGYGVRKINQENELTQYAASFPKDAVFLIQPFMHEPFEAALFYERHPSDANGSLTSITIRHRSFVVGDGLTALFELIKNEKQNDQSRSSLSKFDLMRVPLAGEVVYLTTVASLRVGGRYEDATRMISPQLTSVVNDICISMGEFYWGRLDVKFHSEKELREGKFTIFEINGAGSEAIHCWDPEKPILQAFEGVFRKQRTLFSIAHELRRAGHKPVGPVKLALAWLRQQRLISQYPLSN